MDSPFINFEILGELLDLFVLPFHHLYNGNNSNTFLTELLDILKELMYIKHLEQCLIHSKH